VIIATENDTVYALDASTGGALSASASRAVRAAVGNITVGITGTPVVTWRGRSGLSVHEPADYQHTLWELIWPPPDRGPAPDRPDAAIPSQQARALTLLGSRVYVPFAAVRGLLRLQGRVVGAPRPVRPAGQLHTANQPRRHLARPGVRA